MTPEPLIIDGMDCTRHLVPPGGPKMAPGHHCLRPGCPTTFYGETVWNYCNPCDLDVSLADRRADQRDRRHWMTRKRWEQLAPAIKAAAREGRC